MTVKLLLTFTYRSDPVIHYTVVLQATHWAQALELGFSSSSQGESEV